jgi:hypothetical protein
MFFNIIIFFIILLILGLILKHSIGVKEGFFDLPASHNTFVEDSKAKFNELTTTINLTNPALPVSPDSATAFKIALGGLIPQPTSGTFDFKSKTDYNIPNNTPSTFQQAKKCQDAGATCAAFDDPNFAANCGMSFDINAIGADGKPAIGGLFISPDDRQKQMDAATAVLSTGGPPYDPYKVYQPTLGKSKPGTFALTKDQCVVVKEKVDCASKQTFNSPNCTQCYTTQNFARVGPDTPRIPSTLFLFGGGTVTVSSSNNKISLGQTTLDQQNAAQVNIPADAEGTNFVINVQPTGNTPLAFVAGFIQGQTPRGTFKLDLMSLTQSDLITNAKPHINGSITVNGFRCLTLVPGNKQTTMNLSCLVPFSFLSMYDGDALTCDNGPIITQAASATFLESDPCFGKANQPGNYKLECLQTRWIELGGTPQGTGYPSNQAAADALQKDANGQALDIDAIVNNLAPKMISALSGKDASGKDLSIPDWNTVSMWATGIPINTPCDGPGGDTGPLTQECLSYLYMNQGVTSHIGPTYTLTPSQVASMKGQDSPNTYCQPGTSIDPSTPAGLKFGQGLGGINAVKQTYDQINRLANDNTQTNSARQTAVQQCYGVNLDAKATGKTTGPPQVFAVGPGYNYTKDQAQGICAQYGAQVATSQQLATAQAQGADWCFTAWVSDSNGSQYPINTSIMAGCGNGSTGIINWTPPNNVAGVSCYGPKPGIDNYPQNTILPFNQTSWDGPDSNTPISTCSGPCVPTLTSQNGAYTMVTQTDGNYVMYDSSGKPRWATGTTGRGTGPYKTVMQSDGNLVLYDSNGAALWSSKTAGVGKPPYRLIMQNDGNLVIYDANNYTPWASQTNLDTQFTYGDNGTVSCNTYCGGTGGGPWNNELPREWNGARCIMTSPDIPNCDSTFNFTPGSSYCICTKTGTGWN